MEVAVDECVSGKEVLGLIGRFEALHLSFPPSGRLMCVLGTIIQVLALSMLDTRKQMTLSYPVTPQLVGRHDAWLVLQAIQEPPEETLGCTGIAPVLNKDVEDNAILIHGVPEIVLHTLDPDKYLIDKPLITWPRPGRRRQLAKFWPNFLHQRRTVSYERIIPRSARSSSTSRRLRLSTWYSQTAWLMISAGNRCR
jgi:hypothetical protein